MLDRMRLCKQSTTWYRQASFSSYCLYVIMDRAFMFSKGYSKPCQTKMDYIAKMGNR